MRTSDTRNDDSGQQNQYSYDSVYCVTDAQYDLNGSGGVQRDRRQQSFDFDGVGNRRNVQEISQSQGVSNETYSVNVMNEYSSVSGTTRNHDDNGNLIDNGVR